MKYSISLVDLGALAPLITLLSGALIILIVESVSKKIAFKFSAIISFVTITVAIAAAFFSSPSDNPLLLPWLNFDKIANIFTYFFLFIGCAATLLSATFFEKFESSRGEYFFLLLCSLIGLILIAQARDFLLIFLGIETLSICLYILCGYMKRWNKSHEAAFKYFLMGSIASAFLIYGIALIYGAIGHTRLDSLLTDYRNISSTSEKTLFLGGIAFITLSLAFKTTIVPFHIWAPDVYAGAPLPVTAFMAVGTKVGAFVAFMRIFLEGLPNFDPRWGQGISVLAILTLVYANIVAIRQSKLRRFFAYSGMSHAGFLLLAFVSGTTEAQSAVIFYLVVYSLATFGCFAILAPIDRGEEGISINDLKGLFQRDPISALILTISLLNLAGIPPMAGFFAKFFVLKLAFEAGYPIAVILGLATTVLSAFYYLRIVSVLFQPVEEERSTHFSQSARLVAVVAGIHLIILSIFPSYLPQVARRPGARVLHFEVSAEEFAAIASPQMPLLTEDLKAGQ